jgi:TetR/AcrR family transcriptional repressor of lmrAB and yxaGH operons
MTSTRDQIIETTCDLIELQGHHATGLNQIVRESGAPKGSLYYHFPDGKEEIVAEAVLLAGRRTAERIREGLAGFASAEEAIRQFVANIAHHVELSEFRSGGPLTAVAMETASSSERLNAACREAYSMLQQAFADGIGQYGIEEKRSAELATFITSVVEGGIILSRTYHNADPLRRVGAELAALLA